MPSGIRGPQAEEGPRSPDIAAAAHRLIRLAEQTRSPGLVGREAQIVVQEWQRALPPGDKPAGLVEPVELLRQALLQPGSSSVSRSDRVAVALANAASVLESERQKLLELPLAGVAGASERCAGAAPHAAPTRARRRWPGFASRGLPWAAATCLVAAAVAAGVVLRSTLGQEALGGVFLLAVIITALACGPAIAAYTMVLGALAWDFFFLFPPRSLEIHRPSDIAAFLLFLGAAAICCVIGAIGRAGKRR